MSERVQRVERERGDRPGGEFFGLNERPPPAAILSSKFATSRGKIKISGGGRIKRGKKSP